MKPYNGGMNFHNTTGRNLIRPPSLGYARVNFHFRRIIWIYLENLIFRGLMFVSNRNDRYWGFDYFFSKIMALLDNLVHIKIKNMVDETGADPAKTDEEIRKIKGKRDNNEAISDLENVIYYYENKVEVNF